MEIKMSWSDSLHILWPEGKRTSTSPPNPQSISKPCQRKWSPSHPKNDSWYMLCWCGSYSLEAKTIAHIYICMTVLYGVWGLFMLVIRWGVALTSVPVWLLKRPDAWLGTTEEWGMQAVVKPTRFFSCVFQLQKLIKVAGVWNIESSSQFLVTYCHENRRWTIWRHLTKTARLGAYGSSIMSISKPGWKSNCPKSVFVGGWNPYGPPFSWPLWILPLPCLWWKSRKQRFILAFNLCWIFCGTSYHKVHWWVLQDEFPSVLKLSRGHHQLYLRLTTEEKLNIWQTIRISLRMLRHRKDRHLLGPSLTHQFTNEVPTCHWQFCLPTMWSMASAFRPSEEVPTSRTSSRPLPKWGPALYRCCLTTPSPQQWMWRSPPLKSSCLSTCCSSFPWLWLGPTLCTMDVRRGSWVPPWSWCPPDGDVFSW